MSKRRIERENFFAQSAITPENAPPEFIKLLSNKLSPEAMDAVGYSGAAMPVIQADEKQVRVGHFVVSRTGLVIDAEVTQEEWRAFYDNLQRTRQALQWIIGDWMLYGVERGWATTYEAMAKLTGLQERTIRDYTYICRHVQPSIRIDSLKFAHHQLVVAFANDELKTKWLTFAAEHRLSVRQFRSLIMQQAELRAGLQEMPAQHEHTDPSTRRRFNKLWRMVETGLTHKIKRDDIRLMRAWLDDIERAMEKNQSRAG